MGRPKSYDRADVLDRATGVFWEKGYEGTHVSELCECTGLNRFSLYNEFGGKEGLFVAVLQHYLDGLADLFAPLEAQPLGLANVRAFHRRQLDWTFRHGCFALNAVREKHVIPKRAWTIVQSFSRSMREGLRSNLEAASQSGELGPDRDPAILAVLLAVFDMGLLSYRSMGPGPVAGIRLVEEIERLLD